MNLRKRTQVEATAVISCSQSKLACDLKILKNYMYGKQHEFPRDCFTYRDNV